MFFLVVRPLRGGGGGRATKKITFLKLEKGRATKELFFAAAQKKSEKIWSVNVMENVIYSLLHLAKISSLK